MKPRLLVGCEYSGTVRNAFAALGWDAWSCDLLPSALPGNHIQGDVLTVLGRGWDLFIVHPCCRFLSVSGMHWTKRGLRDPKETDRAIEFAERCWSAPVLSACLENPVGVLSSRSSLGLPSQIIQPYQFGDDASKKTCLWLRNLPLLQSTKYVAPRIVADGPFAGRARWGNQTDSGQNKLGPSERRSLDRAKTYQGIAEAMAHQWSAAFALEVAA